MNLVYAQKRTSVRGYYRKNGTYVSPHTRGYSPGSSSVYSSGYTSSSYTDKEQIHSSSEAIVPTLLKLVKVNQVSDNKKNRSSIYYDVQGRKVTDTKLNFMAIDSVAQQISTNNGDRIDEGIVFYVSVLRYNGKTIDVCPISRGIIKDWAFEKISHEFHKTKITTEHALDLVSNYGWTISGEKISKDFYYEYSDKKLPKYLTKTIEAIKVE